MKENGIGLDELAWSSDSRCVSIQSIDFKNSKKLIPILYCLDSNPGLLVKHTTNAYTMLLKFNQHIWTWDCFKKLSQKLTVWAARTSKTTPGLPRLGGGCWPAQTFAKTFPGWNPSSVPNFSSKAPTVRAPIANIHTYIQNHTAKYIIDWQTNKFRKFADVGIRTTDLWC